MHSNACTQKQSFCLPLPLQILTADPWAWGINVGSCGWLGNGCILLLPVFPDVTGVLNHPGVLGAVHPLQILLSTWDCGTADAEGPLYICSVWLLRSRLQSRVGIKTRISITTVSCNKLNKGSWELEITCCSSPPPISLYCDCVGHN